MDLSRTAKELDRDSGEATHVDRRPGIDDWRSTRSTAVNLTSMIDTTIPIFNNTLNATSKLLETCISEITTAGRIWREANRFTRRTEGID
ncbi:hypothetical protein HALLA_00280 (plasmid) [Halostagnicola larsenii XH-48]|uniref:Uncharacterized protein n=1 Tax=Halostagnicola larsenii XH-48 TaxID=797299 RepID=W0JX02_9EURY|nr:hypothetical protein HALLA_00280 [Halostagnicola larsenii XH-48]